MNMRYWLEYIPFIVVTWIVRLLPRNCALALGRGLGRLAYKVQPKRVRIADDNLQQSTFDLSAEERTDVIRKVFSNFGESFIDMLRLDMYSDDDIDRLFTIEGAEHFEEAHKLNRGSILLTGHIGFWEAGNFLMPKLGYPFSVVAKPMKNPMVDNYFRRMRQAFGTEIIDSRRGARKIVKALQENRAVGVLIDQHITVSEAVSVPFFGRPAWTTPAITQIAMKLQVPVIPAFMYRCENGHYKLKISPMFVLDKKATPENILEGTRLLTEKIEEGVRHDISQWFWIHRRWKHIPENNEQ